MHTPEAHASEPSPQLCPSGCASSGGQSALSPGHVSAMSHRASTAARQTVPALAIWHESEQQSELSGLHTAPEANLHVEASQHGSSLEPGSQSSPSSTMPLPHAWSEITDGLSAWPGAARQVVLSEDDRVVQMLPTEQGEKLETFLRETGDMM